MAKSKTTFTYESIGTSWEVTIWDELSSEFKNELYDGILKISRDFDTIYSRFIPESRILTDLSKPGEKKVSTEFVDILHIYKKLFDLTDGKINPLVGQALEDAGYDRNYSFSEKNISVTPNFNKVIEILDDERIAIKTECIIDIGALGKGFLIDKVGVYLQSKGIKGFMVNGSGDILYFPADEEKKLQIGLEHPADSTKVIGKAELKNGAICSSGSNRRTWGSFHHILDPDERISPQNILATWVTARNATIADAIATSLFLCSPKQLHKEYDFEYAILTQDFKLQRSKGFISELY